MPFSELTGDDFSFDFQTVILCDIADTNGIVGPKLPVKTEKDLSYYCRPARECWSRTKLKSNMYDNWAQLIN